MTTQEHIEQLLAQTRQRADEHGLSVRCPVCNAGIGKWCRVNMDDQTSPIIKHEARVTLANA